MAGQNIKEGFQSWIAAVDRFTDAVSV